MMVYNTQNYWVSELCSSSGILNTRKHNISETGSVFPSSDERREIPTLLGPLEIAMSSDWGQLFLWDLTQCLPPLTLGRKQIQFPERCVP
jgi:hypothetical protein